jgi:hypothetical protein
MSNFRFFLTALLLAQAGATSACSDPPRAEFRDLVAAAPTIFTFQFVSAHHIRESLGGDAYTERVVGHIRVVEKIKGNASAFKLIRYTFRGCGAIRMSVGQIYLAATSQSGPLLQFWGMNFALLDLTRDMYDEDRKRSRAVSIVKGIAGGGAVPRDFPEPYLTSPMEVYPMPPPRGLKPASVAPNNSFKVTPDGAPQLNR